MSIFHLTSELLAHVDQFFVRFHAARMSALADLPGNPYGVELRFFGSGVACKVRHPLLLGKNRIIGFCPGDLNILDDLIRFYEDDGLRYSLSIPHGQTTPELFRRLVQAGLWSNGSGTVLVRPLVSGAYPEDDMSPTPPEIHIRLSGLEEREMYLDLFQRAFAHREEKDAEYRAFQWAEDALPNGRRYVAEIDGVPVGMASFPIVDGVGFFGTAGVLPEYRGRGIQLALIRKRIQDAPSLGCDLVIGGGSPETTTYRNFERAGLRLVPTGHAWGKAPD